MAIFNFGSINIDLFYRVDHIPAPGETLHATSHSHGLGGKGANQSVAAARAGSNVTHIGNIGRDGGWCAQRLHDLGIDISHINEHPVATGSALIAVAKDGENTIILDGGPNLMATQAQLEQALMAAKPRDILVLQNETNMPERAAQIAKDRQMRVVYSAAPFSAGAVEKMLGLVDILMLNAVEADQLFESLGIALVDLPVACIIVTQGANGVRVIDTVKGQEHFQPSFPVEAVDTTGAGDTFCGFLCAGLDQEMAQGAALEFAAAAAAIQVTRVGTADAIPSRREVCELLEKRN